MADCEVIGKIFAKFQEWRSKNNNEGVCDVIGMNFAMLLYWRLQNIWGEIWKFIVTQRFFYKKTKNFILHLFIQKTLSYNWCRNWPSVSRHTVILLTTFQNTDALLYQYLEYAPQSQYSAVGVFSNKNSPSGILT